MKKIKLILICVLSISIASVTFIGCKETGGEERTTSKKENTKATEDNEKENTKATEDSESMSSKNKTEETMEITKIQISYYSDTDPDAEIYVIEDTKKISDIQKKCKEEVSQLLASSEYIGDDSGQTGCDGYSILFFQENKEIQEISMPVRTIMGLDGSMIDKQGYYNVTQYSLFEYIEQLYKDK